MLAKPTSHVLASQGDVVLAEVETSSQLANLRVEGGTVACAALAYGAPDLGVQGLWPLPVCAHVTDLAVPATQGSPVLLIVFNRIDRPVTVSISPP